jgi:hypothetical protein
MKIKIQKRFAALSAVLALTGAGLLATAVGAGAESAHMPTGAAATALNVRGSSIPGPITIMNSSGGPVSTFTEQPCNNTGTVGRYNP